MLIHNLKIAFVLASLDVKQRYARSFLGPFWITITTFIIVFALAVIFGNLFGGEINQYLLYITVGIIFWSFITATISEMCTAFISCESLIKQLNIPIWIYPLRITIRNLYILVHNIIIIPLVYVYLDITANIEQVVFSFFGVLLLSLNLLGLGTVLAFICARFRDVQPITQNLLQLMFYITPILWSIDQIKQRTMIDILLYNPMVYIIDAIRGPLISVWIDHNSFYYSSFFASLLLISAYLVYNKYHKDVVYWL